MPEQGMRFIGQSKIVTEIRKLMQSIEQGNNYNILFRAPSGYGKTTLALMMAAQLGVDNCTYDTGSMAKFRERRNYRRIHIIDEVHEIKEPEYLYEFMNGRYTFILLTNESGILKEPLQNRCIQFIFENYTAEELKYMIQTFLPCEVNSEIINSIYRRSKGNPRIANMICKRLSYIAVTYTPKEIESILDDVINLDKDGLTYLDKKYLDFLEKAGGRAGLDLLSNATKIDKATILKEIEPGLIYLGRIKIGSKGRELCK